MKGKGWILNLALLLGVAALLIWKYFPNEEKAIRQRLAQVAEKISTGANDSMLVRVAEASSLREYFTQDVIIAVERKGGEVISQQGRDELIEGIKVAKGNADLLRQAEFKFLDVQVKRMEADAATVYLTILGDVNGEKNAVTQETVVEMKKTDGDWLIAKVETIRTLQ